MRSVVGCTALLAIALCGPLQAASGGTITFRGAIVEPTCQIGVSDFTRGSSRIEISQCRQSLSLQLSEPRGNQPVVNYRLTDNQGRPVEKLSPPNGDFSAMIRTASQGGARNLVLIAEYL